MLAISLAGLFLLYIYIIFFLLYFKAPCNPCRPLVGMSAVVRGVLQLGAPGWMVAHLPTQHVGVSTDSRGRSAAGGSGCVCWPSEASLSGNTMYYRKIY